MRINCAKTIITSIEQVRSKIPYILCMCNALQFGITHSSCNFLDVFFPKKKNNCKETVCISQKFVFLEYALPKISKLQVFPALKKRPEQRYQQSKKWRKKVFLSWWRIRFRPYSGKFILGPCLKKRHGWSMKKNIARYEIETHPKR